MQAMNVAHSFTETHLIGHNAPIETKYVSVLSAARHYKCKAKNIEPHPCAFSTMSPVVHRYKN